MLYLTCTQNTASLDYPIPRFTNSLKLTDFFRVILNVPFCLLDLNAGHFWWGNRSMVGEIIFFIFLLKESACYPELAQSGGLNTCLLSELLLWFFLSSELCHSILKSTVSQIILSCIIKLQYFHITWCSCIKEEISNMPVEPRNLFEFPTGYSYIFRLLILPHRPLRIKFTIDEQIKHCIFLFKFLNSQSNIIPLVFDYFLLRKQWDFLPLRVLDFKLQHLLLKLASNVKGSSVIPLVKNWVRFRS